MKTNMMCILSVVAAAAMVTLSPGCAGKKSGQPGAGMSRDSTSAADSTVRPASDEVFALTYEERQGKNLFKKYCAVCHGDEGKGDGFNAFNLDPKPRDFTDSTRMAPLTDERIFRTISGGGRSVNKSSLMPSWGGRLKREEIVYLTNYVRQFLKSR